MGSRVNHTPAEKAALERERQRTKELQREVEWTLRGRGVVVVQDTKPEPVAAQPEPPDENEPDWRSIADDLAAALRWDHVDWQTRQDALAAYDRARGET